MKKPASICNSDTTVPCNLISWSFPQAFYYKYEGFAIATPQKREFPFLRQKQRERKGDNMAKANKIATSLNLALMLSLLIFVSIAESRILGGKSSITA